METGFSSPRTDAFPAGLRVLVVDDDLAWLRILEKMLKKCSYEVTTCCLAREALDLLREKKDAFDIVISDVNMPDMDGFKLLEHVGLEMDLPVIMMSVDGETSRVMRGVQHGACDYLLKPIRMKELRNIWQHVFRKRIHEVREIEGHEGIDELLMMRHVLDPSDDGHLQNGGDMTSGKKRKDAESKHDDKGLADSSAAKKARVVWTIELHQKFVKAVNQIGFDKVGPKKILDLMNVPWLTRENVASHLQKYRLYLSRLEKENELKASFGGMKRSESPPKYPDGRSPGLQNSVNIQRNGAATGIYGVSGNINLVRNVDPTVHDSDMKGGVSLPAIEPHKAMTRDIPEAKRAPFATSTFPKTYSWRNVPKIQFKQEHSTEVQVGNSFNHPPLPGGHDHVRDNLVNPPPSISPRPLNREREKMAHAEIKPSYANCRSHQVRQVAPIVNASELIPQTTSFHALGPILSTTLNMKNLSSNQIILNESESEQKNLSLGSWPAFASSEEELLTCLLQGDFYTQNARLHEEAFTHNRPEVFAETPSYSHDPLRLDFEYPWESMECPVIDQALFIA
ncbi:hypothetical protein NMG60_11024817 [Bertholletia excelsa]